MNSVKALRTIALPCAALVLMTAPPARSQSGANASMSDKHFVSEAIKGSLAEVQMGQLAQQKSNSDDVKDFGRKMVEDHTKLGEQMTRVASEIHVASPKSPTMMQQMEIKKLKGMSGDNFDREYIKEMVKDHESDLNDFKKEAASGHSDVVKSAAQQGADVIAQHLSAVHRLADSRHIVVK